jgi:hypothetical protein
MIGYKAFDSNLMCRGFQYEIGKTYEFAGDIELCKGGFHFCENIVDCFYYYSWSEARFAKVEALGKVIKSNYKSKCVTDKIRIIEEISLNDVIKMTNTGDENIGFRNTGDHNSGDWNTGSRNTGVWNTGNKNTGDYNTGNSNSGDWNTGDWNSGACNVGDWNTGGWNNGNRNTGNHNIGDWNKSSLSTGCFMTADNKIMMFNKPSDWTMDDWRNSMACIIMNNCPADCTDIDWIAASYMTDEEKNEHPDYKIKGGYLKVTKYKADKQKWWDDLSYSDKKEVISLPNFDADIFFECTGIKV